MITKHFGVDLSTVTDQQVQAKVAELLATDPVEAALLRAAIKKADGVQTRRLRMALGIAVDKVVLTMSNVPFMTDAEILEGFRALDDDGKADFAVAAFEDESPQGERAQRVLAKIKEDLAAERARQAHEAERERVLLLAERANKERKELLEHPEILVARGEPLDPELAIEFIKRQPFGYFRSVADVIKMITDAAFDEAGKLTGGTIEDMFTGEVIEATAAAVIRFCFVTTHETAKLLMKQLPSRNNGVKKERYFSIQETLSFLQTREAEANRRQAEEEAKELEAEVRRAEVEAMQAAYADTMQPKFAAAADVLTVVRIFLTLVGEEILTAADEWKREVLEYFAGQREYALIGEYRHFLRTKFPTAENISGLEAFVAERLEEYRAYKARKDAGESGASILAEKAHVLLQMASRHLQWLHDNPDGRVPEKTSVVEFPRARSMEPREERRVGTHYFTKGEPGNGRITKHEDPEAAAERRRNRRNTDRKRTQENRGKTGEQGGKKQSQGGRGRK